MSGQFFYRQFDQNSAPIVCWIVSYLQWYERDFNDLEEFNVTLRWGTALKQVLNIMMFCHVLLPDLKSFLLNTCSINYSMYELKEISCNHQRQQTANIYGYYSNMNTYSPQPHHNIKGSRTFLLNILYFLEISISAFTTFVSHTCRTTELKIGHMMRY